MKMAIKKRSDFLLTTSFKATFTFIMSSLALALCLLNPSEVRILCFFGVVFSTIGDLILMNYRDIPEFLFNDNQFYSGILAFMGAHAMYCMCFMKILGKNFLSFDTFNLGTYIAVGMFILSIFIALALIKKKRGIFKCFIIVYVFFIFLSISAIYTCAFECYGKYIFSAIGITLFLISDVMVLLGKAVTNSKFVKKLVWILYPIGQLMIIFSV